jgi:hypothetical protein
MYDDYSIRVRSLFDNVRNVSLTLDGWTSPYGDDFLAVTAHWIDETWTMRESTIGFEPLHGPHTAENVLETLVTIINGFSLGRKILTITTDNAANMIRMLRLLEQHSKKKDNDW